MRLIFLAFIIALAPACATTSGIIGGGDTRLIESTPSGAIARIDGYGECETPCTVKLDRPRYVTIAKAGYTPQTLRLEPRGRTLSVILELAAPTEEVDTLVLPDLE